MEEGTVDFNRSPEAVADDLTDVFVVYGDKRGTVRRWRLYPRDQVKPRFKALFDMVPGAVWCANYRGHCFTMVVVENGGCLLLEHFHDGNKLQRGPGKSSKALGLTQMPAHGTASFADGALTITINSVGE